MSVRNILLPFSWIYALGAWLHAAAYRWRIRTAYQPSIATLAVGNLHVGGTGKTPLSLWLMEQLHQRVEPVYYLSRGYGRRTKEVREVVLEDADGHRPGGELVRTLRLGERHRGASST
jgi:tetraacyldisaccharide 4'-kinase